MLGTGYALPAVLLLRSDRCRCRGAGVRCMAEVHSNNRRACKNENYCPFEKTGWLTERMKSNKKSIRRIICFMYALFLGTADYRVSFRMIPLRNTAIFFYRLAVLTISAILASLHIRP